MYHSAARVVHIDKSGHQEYIDYILDDANNIPLDIRPVVANSDYTIFVLDVTDFDRMMKHFDPDYMPEAERSAAINKIIFKKADEIKRLEAEIERLNKVIEDRDDADFFNSGRIRNNN